MSLSKSLQIFGLVIVLLAALVAILGTTTTSSDVNATIANMTVNIISFFYVVIIGVALIAVGEAVKKFE